MFRKIFFKKNKIRLTWKIGIGLSAITAGSIFLKEEQLRIHPLMISNAMLRMGRVGIAGVRMLNVYKGPFDKHLPRSEIHTKSAEILRECFRKNSGSFIKIGQLIALLDNLIPNEYCEVMKEMFQNAPETQISEIYRVIEEETGKKISDIFESFDEIPISSASIAQVHTAILRNGKKVAVKVQHPWLRENVPIDIKTVCFFIGIGTKFIKGFNYNWFARDMKRLLPKEIDFKNEATNMAKIRPLLKGCKVKIPLVYDRFLTDRLLIMEFVEGYSITNLDRMKKDGFRFPEVAKHLSIIFNKMIFEIGFCHGDPHPGNIFIQKVGDKGDFNIVLLDHGLYSSLNRPTQVNYSKLWCGIILQNPKMIQESAQALGVDDYKLFASMVTQKRFHTIMNKNEKSIKKRLRGGKKLDSKEKEWIMDVRKDIAKCLNIMHPDLVQIFKVNDYITSIDKKLGTPINNYYYTAKYSFYNYLNSNQFDSFWKKMYFRYTVMKNLMLILIYEFYLKF